MNTHTQNVLEISRTTSRLITLGAAFLVLLVFGIGANFAQMAQLEWTEQTIDLGALRCASSVLPHFPLQVGNQWNYSKQGIGDAQTWQVAVVEGTAGAGSELQGYFGASHTVCAGTSGVIHEVTADAGDAMWYNLGATVGSTWHIHLDQAGDNPDCVDGSQATIGSRTDHVDVPAGSFDNVIRIDYRSPCSDAGIVAEWFAPGVGLVKRTEQSFAGPVVSELQSAVVGGFVLPQPALTTSFAVNKALYIVPVSFGSSGSIGPMLEGNLVLRNSTAQPSTFDFAGCASMTVSVIDKLGKIVLSARADDGSDCKSHENIHVAVSGTPLALPISMLLQTKDGVLAAGRYLVVATLDTLDAAPLRPSASATIDIQEIQTSTK